MLENHSFDNIFAFSGIPDLHVATTKDANEYDGKTYKVVKGAPVTMPTDPGHEFPDVVEQLGGKDAKFKKGKPYPEIHGSGYASNYATTTTEGPAPSKSEIGDIMACFDTKNQLPVIYQLATEFAICDHWFSSLPGPTWPNRFFVHGASSAGLDHSPSNKELTEWETVSGFWYENGSIYDALNKAKISWRLYVDRSGPVPGAVPQVSSLHGIQITDVHGLSSFAADLQGPYPYTYTFIEPNYGNILNGSYSGGSSQHPMDGVFGGEYLIKTVYEAIRNSPFWDSSLFIITYDEHGGFYDSIKPTEAPKPGDKFGKDLNEYGFEFDVYGVRVPAVIVSPLIPKGTVDHTLYDHASIPATLERLYDFPSLTKRDKNANDLRYLLSLASPRTNCPTQLNNPAPAPVSFAVSDEDAPANDQDRLPEEGNVRGFLQIMLKAELDLASSELQKASIIENFKKIKTYGDAKAYVDMVDEKIATVKEMAR
jgi:phospholipase C